MILVTGGTGLVGAHLLFELAQKNEKLRAAIRATSDTRQVKKVFEYYCDKARAHQLFNRIEWVTADINDIPALDAAFKDINNVYHCAALISFDPSDEKKLRKINIEGTANIVNLCISHRVEKLCYVSSVAAIGSAKNSSSVDENTKWNPEEDHNDYAISKYGAEIEVWRGTQEGINTVIVNPGIIIGPGFWDSGSGKIFRRIDNGLKHHFPKVSGFVGVKDVVQVMTGLMESPVVNEKYILVSENISFEKVLKETAEYLEKPKPDYQLKKWMIALGWFFQKIGSWFGAKREITRDSIQGLYEETYYDNSKIRNNMDFEFTPVSEVLKETAEIYRRDH
ncbi:NAD-dependent epimerase/dehydratase family protein [Pontixanthobacter gangjinensis]|uniref:NAD-dependent epimerase/dehydratase family protein n=1 Tax=Christiangramia aestuarii TaxID=1028746 RepID=A0A7K1LN67_9FLAO|nr:NAD-dependent epimerase/dehydratase family protein [Christiangramia aestuarii]MUP42249.1 NAD-dependent epimerase/dehydratase family protein [Christiangramia aestuarii]